VFGVTREEQKLAKPFLAGATQNVKKARFAIFYSKKCL
jgi:hypothetical protein